MKKLALIAEITLSGQGLKSRSESGVTLELNYDGRGSSIIMEDFEIRLLSADHFNSGDNFDVIGSFAINSGQDRLLGKISGSGSYVNGQYLSSELWEIESGSGKYQCATGQITARLSNEIGESESLNLILFGVVSMPRRLDEIEIYEAPPEYRVAAQ